MHPQRRVVQRSSVAWCSAVHCSAVYRSAQCVAQCSVVLFTLEMHLRSEAVWWPAWDVDLRNPLPRPHLDAGSHLLHSSAGSRRGVRDRRATRLPPRAGAGAAANVAL